MGNRIHEYLDGELPLDALSAEEREQAQEMETLISSAATRLRSVPVPDLTARIMAALPDEALHAHPSWLARAAGWLWNPRPIRLHLRPAYALAALATMLLLVPWVLRTAVLAPEAGPLPVGVSAEVPQVYVQFRLEAPDANEVRLAGSFTDWEPRYQLLQMAPGIWSAVVPLHPGVHDYTFVVDGVHWITDPHAPAIPDPFGGANSRLTLVPPHNGV